MRLTFDDADVETKSDDDSDVVEVYIPTLDDGRLVVWQVEFESDDPRFSGTMAMHWRSEEHTSELQSLMRISYAVFCLKKKKRSDVPNTLYYRIIKKE